MRVRVWIEGPEGPSQDFELAEAPRAGDCISIAVAGRLEEGMVTSVTWQLIGIEGSTNDLILGVEPVGSVTLVHVMCKPSKNADTGTAEGAVSEKERVSG